MKQLLQYLGILLMLVGVVLEIVYYFGARTNGMLLAAAIFIVLGCVGHIVLNHYLK